MSGLSPIRMQSGRGGVKTVIQLTSRMIRQVSHPDSSWNNLREAYRRLDESEKAKLMRFTARRRFSDDMFESWVRESGLQSGEIRREMIAERTSGEVRERLDTAILQERNEALFCDVVTKYLSLGDPALVEYLVQRLMERSPCESGPMANRLCQMWEKGELPEALKSHPQLELLQVAVAGGLLNDFLERRFEGNSIPLQEDFEANPEASSEEGVPVQEPPEEAGGGSENQEENMTSEENRSEQTEQLPDPAILREEFRAYQEELEGMRETLNEMRLLPGKDQLSGLLQRVADLAVRSSQLRDACGSYGISHWEDFEELQAKVEAIRDESSRWAEEQISHLEGMEVNHPLRRKREAFLALRLEAVKELRSFEEQAVDSASIPGRPESGREWWQWATCLDGADFDQLEEWCSSHGLNAMADLLVEQWSGCRAKETDASEVDDGNHGKPGREEGVPSSPPNSGEKEETSGGEDPPITTAEASQTVKDALPSPPLESDQTEHQEPALVQTEEIEPEGSAGEGQVEASDGSEVHPDRSGGQSQEGNFPSGSLRAAMVKAEAGRKPENGADEPEARSLSPKQGHFRNFM